MSFISFISFVMSLMSFISDWAVALVNFIDVRLHWQTRGGRSHPPVCPRFPLPQETEVLSSTNAQSQLNQKQPRQTSPATQQICLLLQIDQTQTDHHRSHSQCNCGRNSKTSRPITRVRLFPPRNPAVFATTSGGKWGSLSWEAPR